MMGRTLAQVRQRLDLTPAEMAERLGVAKSTYDAYERASRDPDNAVLDRLLALAWAELDDAELLAQVEGKVEDIRARRHKSAPYAGYRGGAQTTRTAQRSRQRGQAAAAERARLLKSNTKGNQP
jgi:transcriptional regulator with XRE-family HTH domain